MGVHFLQQMALLRQTGAVWLHPGADGMIGAFLGHWREGDKDSFKLRSRRGLNSHLLAGCSLQKDACEKIITGIAADSASAWHKQDWPFCFLNKTKSSFRKMVILKRGFWSQDPEQYPRAAQGRQWCFGERIWLHIEKFTVSRSRLWNWILS